MGLLSSALELLNKRKVSDKITDRPVDKQTSYATEEIKSPKYREPVPPTMKISINMGIDFGTSYSKVCFAERKTFNFVKFDKDEYKPSILYFDYKGNLLYYDKPNETDNIEEIKYFKYSMLNDNLPRSINLAKLKLSVKPEILCSLFFLACLIKESKEYACNYFKEKRWDFEIDQWYITMGVPIDNFENENHQLYDRLFILADKLSAELTNNAILINNLYKYFLNKQNIQIPEFSTSNLNTLPELYAESLAFLQNRNVMTGVYALVDIGGGTVDMAIMFKEAPNKFSIVSKIIQPLGIDIIANNIIDNPNKIEQVKYVLKKRKNLAELSYISREKENEYKEMFKQAFATVVVDTNKKNVLSNAKHVLYLNNRTLPVIICGGGANHKWYEDGVLQTGWEQLKRIISDERGLKLKIEPVDKLLPKSIKNHRLLIAYILAHPIESIPFLAGYPWHFQEINPTSVTEDAYDRHYAGQIKLWENSGEYL
jgi:hypothetical protein